jgi:hypothetical protein
LALGLFAPNGKPISIEEWCQLFGKRAEYRHWTTTEFGYTISTVWLGLSESNWEVALIDNLNGDELTIVARAHCNEQEAKKYHEEWVSKINRGIWRRNM